MTQYSLEASRQRGVEYVGRTLELCLTHASVGLNDPVECESIGAWTDFIAAARSTPWAVLAGAGIAPPVNGFALWLGAIVLYLAAFVWRKYR